MTLRQLALPFTETPHYAAQDFVAAAANERAREVLGRPDSWSNGRLVLWGEAGCGKTHLAHIFAERHGAVLLAGARLPPLQGPPAHPLAIDDADTADEASLLHHLNAAAEAKRVVLLTAQSPPARQTIALPDLASRLRASETAQILPPDDEFLAALLSRLAAERQLVLPLPVRNYLLTRLPRTAAALRDAIARLDHAALAKRAAITRRLAAELLADIVT